VEICAIVRDWTCGETQVRLCYSGTRLMCHGVMVSNMALRWWINSLHWCYRSVLLIHWIVVKPECEAPDIAPASKTRRMGPINAYLDGREAMTCNTLFLPIFLSFLLEEYGFNCK